MASFSDALGLLTKTGLFQIIVPIIFVYAVMFALLSFLKFGGKQVFEKSELRSVVAFVIALAVVIFPAGREFLMNFVPMIAVLSIIIFLLIFLVLTVLTGQKEEDIPKQILSFTTVIFWPAVLLGLVMLMAAVTNVFPNYKAENVEQIAIEQNKTIAQVVDEMTPGGRIIYYLSLPQVLGLIVLFGIFMAIAFFIPGASNALK